MNSGMRVAAGVTLVVMAAVAGVAWHRLISPRTTLRVEPAHARAPLPQSPVRSRVIPTVLPDLSLEDAAGVRRPISEWTGHPLVINFWATWCEPCRREIPLLIRLRHQRAGAGLVVVGVAVDFRAAVMKYARDAGIDYPLLLGENGGLEAVNAFGMELVFPFSVFVDSRARIVAVKVGELHQKEADFILDRVEDIDRGGLDLPGARELIEARLKELAVERAKGA